MPPETHREFALRRFIETRLSNKDYMSTHTLEDVRKSALRRWNTIGFDQIFDECVNKIKGRKK